jgi:hypothetical protein
MIGLVNKKLLKKKNMTTCMNVKRLNRRAKKRNINKFKQRKVARTANKNRA